MFIYEIYSYVLGILGEEASTIWNSDSAFF